MLVITLSLWRTFHQCTKIKRTKLFLAIRDSVSLQIVLADKPDMLTDPDVEKQLNDILLDNVPYHNVKLF